MANNFTADSGLQNDYVRMNDGSYVSKQDLIKDSNTVKVNPNQGVIGTAVDQLGNDLGTLGGGLLGLAGSDTAMKRAQSNMIANQYIDSQKDYGNFSGSGLLNLGIRQLPMMVGTLGAGAVAKRGAQAVVENMLEREMTKQIASRAFTGGLGVAGGLQNVGFENAQQYHDTGKQLSGPQALADFTTGAILNSVEGNALLGKYGQMSDLTNKGLNLATRGGNALKTGATAGGINVAQDIVNRAVAGRDLASGDAVHSYGQQLATGGLIGGLFGGLHSSRATPESTAITPADSSKTQAIQPRTDVTQSQVNPEVTTQVADTTVANPFDNLTLEGNTQPQETQNTQVNKIASPYDMPIISNADINARNQERYARYLQDNPPQAETPNPLRQDNSLLQLGYDSNVRNPEPQNTNIMYGTDTGILGRDINQVSDQRLNDYLASGNRNDAPVVESIRDVTPQAETPNIPQLGYDPNAGKPVMYASDTGAVGRDANAVSQQRLKDLYTPQEIKQVNNAPSIKSRQELLNRLQEKNNFKDTINAKEPVLDTTTGGLETPARNVNPGLQKLVDNKNAMEVMRKQEQLSSSKNPSFENDIRTITGDNTLFKNGEFTFTNKDLAKPVETAIKGHAEDIRSGDVVAKQESSPIKLDDNVKAVATNNIKNPKVKNEFIKLNEKVLENPSPEKINLLNNVKNEISKSNVSDSSKLMNTISKVADNLTEKTAKDINDSFSNKSIDQAYVNEITAMAENRRNEIANQVDQAKQDNFNKLISNENEQFKNYDNALMQSTPSVDKDGVTTYSMKDGNSTIEKVVDKANDTTQYLRDGQLHNEFGPALIEGKKKEYYLFDDQLSKKDWRDQLNEINATRPQVDALKKNEVRLKASVLSSYLKDLVNNNQLSDAVELKKQNTPLPKEEQSRIDSLNNSLNDVKNKVNVDIEVISPVHSIDAEVGSQVYGWFDSAKNKIYVVGTDNIKDTMATVLRHELYHKGISVYLKGVEREQFTKELDKLYQNKLIKDIADNIMKDEGYANDKYVAIEEALSKIVENENNIIQNPKMFDKIFDYFKTFLNKLLGTESFTSNRDVKNFIDKTQPLAMTPEEIQPIRNNFENVVRFSREIRDDDKTRQSLQETIRNIKYNNQVDRHNQSKAGQIFDDAMTELSQSADTNLMPYANPLGTKYFNNKFNKTVNGLLQWTMKQDHLLGFHGKVGQSILNVINSVNTFKGDAMARLENESSNLFKYEKKLNEIEKGKIFDVLGRYAYEVKNDKDPRSVGMRIDDATLTQQLKDSGLNGQKLTDAIAYAKEIRNVADYGIHISKMNDSLGMWETIKNTINGYDETFGDKIDSIITQSFRNEFEKYGVKLGDDSMSIRNFNSNFEKVLNDSRIKENIQDIINQKTKAIEDERNSLLSVDVSNMTKGEHQRYVDKVNGDADAKLNSIIEQQHLDNINLTINKLKEFQDEATSREDKGYIHKDMSGKYFLTVKTMVNGQEVKYTLASDDINELSKINSQLKNQFGDSINTNTGMRQSVNPKDLVNSILSLEAYGGELSTDQMNLLSILEGYGDKIKRQYEGPGYNQNLVKVLSDYSFNKINQMSGKHKMGDISMLLNSIDGSNKASIKAQVTDILQTINQNRTIPSDTLGSKIRGVTSIWALGANLSNTVAQVFQTGMIAPNYFKRFTNDTTWLSSLQNAMRYLSEKTSGDKDLDALIGRLQNNDLLTSSMAKSMFEIKDNPFGKGKFDKVKEKAYFLNEWTEKRLRYATAIESFNIYKAEQLKKSQGKDYNKEVLSQSLDNFVLNNIRDVNGDFSKQNRAKLYQSDLAATLMMFQDWKAVTFNAFRKMNRPEQIKFALQHSMLMGGILGVPFADDIVELTDAFFKFFGVQPPVRQHIEKTANYLDESIMNGVGDWFKHGLPYIGEKIGLGQVIPNLQGAIELATGDKNKGLKGLLGPSGNLITNMASGLQQVGSGLGTLATTGGDRGYESVGRGFINMSPGVLKSFEKGLEVGATGQLQSSDGGVKMYDVNRLNGLLLAGNFRTPGMADTIDEYNVLKEYKTIQDNKMKEFKSAYIDAYHNKDFKEMASIDAMAKSVNPKFNSKDLIKNDKSSISMKDRFIKSLPKDSQTEYKKLL